MIFLNKIAVMTCKICYNKIQRFGILQTCDMHGD